MQDKERDIDDLQLTICLNSVRLKKRSHGSHGDLYSQIKF